MANLLREYIRVLLTESIDPKIMSMIDRIEAAGYKVNVSVSRGSAWIYDPEIDVSTFPTKINVKNRVAGVSWYPGGSSGPDFGPCLQSAVVNSSWGEEGLGPLAYDIAIEASGGLTSDRTEVSADAESVWDYYSNHRSDVNVEQLDILDGYGRDQLTPGDESDDCDQIPADQRYGPEWYKSGMSKKISKSGTPVIDELRKRGMLDE